MVGGYLRVWSQEVYQLQEGVHANKKLYGQKRLAGQQFTAHLHPTPPLSFISLLVLFWLGNTEQNSGEKFFVVIAMMKMLEKNTFSVLSFIMLRQ